MSNISVNTITDASGGSTASINGLTPQASNMQPHNWIINGAMEVSQRGTSFTSSSAIYTLDRWKSQARAGATVTTTQEANQIVDGFNLKVLQFSVTTPASDSLTILNHYVENAGINLYGKTLTVSWYAKITSGSATVQARFEGNNATQFSSNTSALTGDWQRFSYTFVFTGYTYPPSYDHGRLMFYFTGASAHTIQITGVQLEAGSTASSFAHENYGDTLSKCQRYFQIVEAHNRFRAAGTSHIYTNTVNYFVEMRAIPTTSKSGGVVSNIGLEGLNSVTTRAFRYELTNTSAGDAYQLGRIVSLDAEL